MRLCSSAADGRNWGTPEESSADAWAESSRVIVPRVIGDDAVDGGLSDLAEIQ
jgi:hypothetical protein